ncbi:g891 [Coccomyxa elongata]
MSEEDVYRAVERTGEPWKVGALLASAGVLFVVLLGASLLYVYYRKRRAELRFMRTKIGGRVSLGSGSYGKVHKAKLTVRSEGLLEMPVAVKTILLDEDSGARVQREVILLEKTSNLPNVVGYFRCDFVVTRWAHHIVMELMEGGNLAEALHGKLGVAMVPDARALTWDTGGKQLALRIVRGVIQLHSIQVVHCDITPSNILLNKAWTEAKIGDVGLGRYMLGSRLSPVSKVFGTLCYIAPEVHRSVRQDEASGVAQHYCNEKIDVFSLGVLLWQMVTGEKPYLEKMLPEMVEDMDRRGCTEEVQQVIRECLATDPRGRPCAWEVLARLKGSAEMRGSLGRERDTYAEVER